MRPRRGWDRIERTVDEWQAKMERRHGDRCWICRNGYSIRLAPMRRAYYRKSRGWKR